MHSNEGVYESPSGTRDRLTRKYATNEADVNKLRAVKMEERADGGLETGSKAHD